MFHHNINGYVSHLTKMEYEHIFQHPPENHCFVGILIKKKNDFWDIHVLHRIPMTTTKSHSW